MKTKDQYMAELAHHIRKLPEQDARELLADYEAHFEAGRENGKSDEQICVALGNPKAVGQEIMMTTWAKRVDSAPRSMRSPSTLLHVLVMILVLAPLNFFMFLCPFLVLFVLIITGWCMPLVIAGVALTAFGFFMNNTGAPIDALNGLSLLFMFFGTLGLAVLSALLMWLVTLGSFKVLIAFIKWNIDFITSRRAHAPAFNGGRA